MAYTTDLTVAQFELLEQLLPQSRTCNSVICRHQIVNAIFYQLKNGCQWRDLPADFPNWQTVYSQFRRWRLDGTWQKVLAALAHGERQKVKKRISKFADWRFDVREKYGHGKSGNKGLLLVQSDERD